LFGGISDELVLIRHRLLKWFKGFFAEFPK